VSQAAIYDGKLKSPYRINITDDMIPLHCVPYEPGDISTTLFVAFENLPRYYPPPSPTKFKRMLRDDYAASECDSPIGSAKVLRRPLLTDTWTRAHVFFTGLNVQEQHSAESNQVFSFLVQELTLECTEARLFSALDSLHMDFGFALEFIPTSKPSHAGLCRLCTAFLEHFENVEVITNETRSLVTENLGERTAVMSVLSQPTVAVHGAAHII
jgi:hypothetical protein